MEVRVEWKDGMALLGHRIVVRTSYMRSIHSKSAQSCSALFETQHNYILVE